MNFVARTTCMIILAITANVGYAKTFKYEITNVHSSEGYEVKYPGLELNNIKSATLTVNKDPLLPDWQLSSLEITFNTAAKLTATGFKKVSYNTYRAVVNDVWVFRQLIIDVTETDLNIYQNPFVNVKVSVSEKYAFNTPELDSQGHELFHAGGAMRDISPIKIVDIASIVLDGKRVNFSLRERPGILVLGANGPEQIRKEGFLVDVLWMGKGQKTISLYASSLESFAELDALALLIEERDGDFGTKEQVMSVKYKDVNGSERVTFPTPIRPLLESVYGTTMQ
ncbi:MAG: hypothetical protein K0Q67_1490 [Cellvibrio sp.]|nr:hypothetical protein [Cellvibrio sp.]